MTHRQIDPDLIVREISISRELTPELVEVLDLLELAHGDSRGRASVPEWRRVDAVAARLAEARAGVAPIPTPRPVADPVPAQSSRSSS